MPAGDGLMRLRSVANRPDEDLALLSDDVAFGHLLRADASRRRSDGSIHDEESLMGKHLFFSMLLGIPVVVLVLSYFVFLH